MAALTANRAVGVYSDQKFTGYPVLAASTIYRGAYVGLHPVLGYAKPFEGGDLFIGVADEYVDNSAGSNATKYVRVLTHGDIDVTVSGASFDEIGRDVYATNSGDAALLGNRDGFIGYAIQRGNADGTLRVRLCGPTKPKGFMRGSVELALDGATAFTATGATAGTNVVGGSGLFANSALGLGVTHSAESIIGTFDAVAEVASAGLNAPSGWKPSSGGMLAYFRLHLSNIGDNAALDTDWGVGTVLTSNSIANIDHADMVNLAAFHMDGNAADILAQSDNNVTDVSAVDTTVDNVATAAGHKDFHVLIRPTGSVEFYIDGARVLSSTTFAVDSATAIAPFLNMEKTSDDTTAVWNLTNFRFTAGKSA